MLWVIQITQYNQQMHVNKMCSSHTTKFRHLPIAITVIRVNTALVWVVMQRVLVIIYQRFGKKLSLPSSGGTTPDEGTDRLSLT